MKTTAIISDRGRLASRPGKQIELPCHGNTELFLTTTACHQQTGRHHHQTQQASREDLNAMRFLEQHDGQGRDDENDHRVGQARERAIRCLRMRSCEKAITRYTSRAMAPELARRNSNTAAGAT